MFAKLAEIRKAIVTALGLVLTVLTFVTNNFGGLLPTSATTLVASIVAVVTVVLTYLTPNKTAAV